MKGSFLVLLLVAHWSFLQSVIFKTEVKVCAYQAQTFFSTRLYYQLFKIADMIES